MSILATFFLAFSASFFYLAASLILKQWATMPVWLAVAGVGLCLALASLAEIAVLQRARFAEVVILIITLEIGMAVLLARLLFSEAYGLRDLAGGLRLLGGAALLLWAPPQETPPEADGQIALSAKTGQG